MNHISSKWLKKVRWLFLLYGAHFIVIYLYIGIHYGQWGGNQKFPITVMFLIGLQIIYETVASVRFVKRSAYLTTTITTCLVLIETALVFNPTGVYYSPYMIVFIIAAFIMGALGWIVPLIVLGTMTTFSIFGFSGFIQSPVGDSLRFKLVGVGELALVALAVLGGYYFWRQYYDFSENYELKRLNSKLKRGTQQSTTILNSIGDGGIVFDSKGAVDLINPQASAITGWEVKESMGVDVHKIVRYSNPDPNTADQPMPDVFAEALRQKKHINETLKLESPKLHSTLIVLISISPIIIPPDNELVGGVAIIHDVTKEQELEQQRNDFISTASHEMRTPIATIEGYLDTALSDKSGALKPPIKEYIEEAHKSTMHLGRLFQDLLTSSQAQDGKLLNRPQVIEMGEFLRQLNENYNHLAVKKGLALEYNLGENQFNIKHIRKTNFYVYADPERLRELTDNLYDNALKYTSKGGIHIGLRADDKEVSFYIKDSGGGIPSDDLAHLFQKFYRVDNSPTRTIGGTGLGLFICRKIVELYGGRIWAESELNKGSTFYVKLPRLTPGQIKQLSAKQSESELTTEAKTSVALA